MAFIRKSIRQTLKILITDKPPHGLGFCCEFAFFTVRKQTGLIAERLGVTDRAVRYHKRAFKDGCTSCEKNPNCLKGRLI